MNVIAETESPLVTSAATRTGRPFVQSSEDSLEGGFPDAAAAQRHADRATAARLTYEARIARERKDRDQLTQVAALAREEGRAEALVQLAAERHAGFVSGLPLGFALGFPIGGAFFTAVAWIGAHWKGLA